MKEKHKNEIKKLFHTVKLQTTMIKQQLKSVEDTDLLFLNKFRSLCKECINPVIEDIGNHIREMGGDYSIEEFHEDQLQELGIRGKPFLRLTIAIPGLELDTQSRNIPNLVFSGDKYRNKVSCMLDNIGYLSTANHQTIKQWAIDEITADKVEKTIVAYMKVIAPA